MKKRTILTICLVCLLLTLTGCAKTATDEEAFGFTAAPPRQTVVVEEFPDGQVELEDDEVPLAALPVYLPMPAAVGATISADHNAIIDYSNAQDGYVMARYTSAAGKALRVQIQGPKELYTYELPDGKWAAFPLSEGSGAYQVTLLENRSGRKYDILTSADFQAEIDDELAPFLRPTENVNYTEAENTVQKALELTGPAETPLERAAAVYEFVTSCIADNGVEAAGGKSGYLPVLDDVLADGMGSYYGRAALMAGMLRSQGVPCKISVGYTGKARHTCVGVWTEETGWIDDLMFYDGETWQWTAPGADSRPGSGSRYTVKFVY